MTRPGHQLFTASAVFLMLAGCGGGSSNSGTGPNPNPNPNPTGTLTLAISPANTSLPQGGSMQMVATAARVNFTGAVTLTVSGAPAGVTSTISQPQGTGAIVTGTLIFVAAAATAPGTYSLTIQAAGTGVASVSATFALTSRRLVHIRSRERHQARRSRRVYRARAAGDRAH